MKEIHVFDFDGTLTSSDSFVALIRFAHGDAATVRGLLACSAWLVLMKLRLYDNGKAKQRVFAHFFAGMAERDFSALGQRFADANARIMRTKALGCMRNQLRQGHRVIVVSASMSQWVKPFLTPMMQTEGADITVIGTEPEVSGGLLTGRFATPNCYGQQKVERLKALVPSREGVKIIAYGDSLGDKQLMEYADEKHFRPFE